MTVLLEEGAGLSHELKLLNILSSVVAAENSIALAFYTSLHLATSVDYQTGNEAEERSSTKQLRLRLPGHMTTLFVL